MVGGSGSGKSAYAEQLAASLAPRRVYLATMRAEGAEAHARIERHRAQREGLNFATYETPTAASICAYARRETDSLPNLPEAAVLLDGCGNPPNCRDEGNPPNQLEAAVLLDNLGNLANRREEDRIRLSEETVLLNDRSNLSSRRGEGDLPNRRDEGNIHNLSEVAVLLDDLGNLVANELFARDGSVACQEHVVTRIEDAITTLGQSVAHLVVVADEVGSAGSYGDVGTDAWVRLVGTLCCRIAAHSDLVVELVSGIPVIVKNELTSGFPVAARDVPYSGIPVMAKSELMAGISVAAKDVPSTGVSVGAKCGLVSDTSVTAKCALVADSPMAVEVEIP